MKHEIKPLTYKTLDGLSERQITEHHDVLYTGYVKKLNEIEEELINVDRTAANATFSQLRALKKEEVFATNGKQLHEEYFDNLGGDNKIPENIEKIIAKHFESYEKWEEDFKACGLAARGWVVLAYNFQDKRLHNYISDTHDMGGVWSCIPLIVLDVYEHAYFLDYGVKRKDYIEKFIINLNWPIIEKRFKVCL